MYAPELTRKSIWQAIQNRRCYALTGDRIELDVRLNDARMGEEIMAGGEREIRVTARGRDVLDKIEVIKNNKPLKRYFGPRAPEPGDTFQGVIRIEWGWGDKEESVRWDGELKLSEGRIDSVEPCFTGDPVLAPSEDGGGVGESEDPIHGIVGQDEQTVEWFSHTQGNLHPFLRGTSALVLEVDAPVSARFDFKVNGKTFGWTVAELAEGSRSDFLRGWRSEAVMVHKAVPDATRSAQVAFVDSGESDGADYYYVRVAQENNQWAWSSPIWITG